MRPNPTTSTVDDTHQAIWKKWQLSYSSTLELCNESCTFDAAAAQQKSMKFPKRIDWDYGIMIHQKKAGPSFLTRVE